MYQRALDFCVAANAIRNELPQGRSAPSHQLDRAATSIALNIPEGGDEFAAPEKARFYRIARRSATECAAILDVAQALELTEATKVCAGKDQLRTVVAMLIGSGKMGGERIS